MASHYEELQEQFSILSKQLDPNDPIWDFLFEFIQKWKEQGVSYLARLRNTSSYHESLLKTLKSLHEERDISKLLDAILDKAIELTQAERGFLLVEEQRVARNFTKECIVGDFQISNSIACHVRKTGEAILTDNAKFDPRFNQKQSIQEFHLLSILCIPIMLNHSTIGVIYLDNRLVRGCFNQDSLAILTAFAEQASVALYNARLHQKLLLRSQALDTEVMRKTEELEFAKSRIFQLISPNQYQNIYSRNAEMKKIFGILDRIKDLDCPVLIQGESGTGKELIANAIHYSSHRKDQPFISQNAAAISSTLIESELFGHVRGAFTGAISDKKGLFEHANGGTLFLDEIGEISNDLQAKLLRAIEEKYIEKVGKKEERIPIDVRLITATNRNLIKMVAEGKFREDLYYRLNVIPITLPPLRERKEDIQGLVERFIAKINQEEKKNITKVENGLLDIFLRYDWPGNIRELYNIVLQVAAMDDHVLRIHHLPEKIKSRSTPASQEQRIRKLSQAIAETERMEIQKALNCTKNSKTAAAELLGISRFTLQRKIEKLEIFVPDNTFQEEKIE